MLTSTAVPFVDPKDKDKPSMDFGCEFEMINIVMKLIRISQLLVDHANGSGRSFSDCYAKMLNEVFFPDVHQEQVRYSPCYQDKKLIQADFSDGQYRASKRGRQLISSRISFVISVLNWLSETPHQRATNATPGYMTAGMARECQYTIWIRRLTQCSSCCCSDCTT